MGTYGRVRGRGIKKVMKGFLGWFGGECAVLQPRAHRGAPEALHGVRAAWSLRRAACAPELGPHVTAAVAAQERQPTACSEELAVPFQFSPGGARRSPGSRCRSMRGASRNTDPATAAALGFEECCLSCSDQMKASRRRIYDPALPYESSSAGRAQVHFT